MGINPFDLKEKTIEEFKYEAKHDPNATDQVVEIRYIHYESRRRKKLKILAEYLRNNKHILPTKKDQDPQVK